MTDEKHQSNDELEAEWSGQEGQLSQRQPTEMPEQVRQRLLKDGVEITGDHLTKGSYFVIYPGVLTILQNLNNNQQLNKSKNWKQRVGSLFNSCLKPCKKETALTSFKCAVKYLEIDQMTSDFIDSEVKTLEQLDHPNIVSLLSIERYTIDLSNQTQRQLSCVCLIMEHPEHGSLESYISRIKDKQESQFTQEQMKTIVTGVESGLKALHDSGRIYRNCHLRNVWLFESLQPKLADFGLVKELSDRPELLDKLQKIDLKLFQENSSAK